MPGQFHDNMAQMQHLQMPQTYVGHETYVRSPQTMEWHSQSMPSFQFGNHMHPMSALQTPTSPYSNGPLASPVNNMFPMNQQSMQGFANGWQQSFPHHTMHGPRPDMQFGSDPNFLHSGYAAPDGSVEPDLSLINYAMHPTSSASNTQPNSRPSSNANTEPSSPVTTKKRKLNIFQTDSLRMTSSNPIPNGVTSKTSPPPPNSNRKQRKSFVKHENPPTPLSKTPTVDEEEMLEEDAEYDEEDGDDPQQSASPPAPWPASKARPQHKPQLPPKPKPRKKSTVDSPVKPKPRRASSSANNISRTPLTAEQKKANHTNSEQRRRDATARSYAELYDLVPELEDLGKQSTMKKLEVVVEKVRGVKQRVEYLRSIMGRDPATGNLIPGQIARHQFGGDMSHLSGWR